MEIKGQGGSKMKKLFVFLVVALLFVGAKDVWGGVPNIIDACVDNNNGNTRILAPNSNSEECRNSENPVSWIQDVEEDERRGPQVFDANGLQVGEFVQIVNFSPPAVANFVLVSFKVGNDVLLFQIIVGSSSIKPIFGSVIQSIYYRSSNCSGVPFVNAGTFNNSIPPTVVIPADYVNDPTNKTAFVREFGSGSFFADFRSRILSGSLFCTSGNFTRRVFPLTQTSLEFDQFVPPFVLK